MSKAVTEKNEKKMKNRVKKAKKQEYRNISIHVPAFFDFLRSLNNLMP